jgi:hypothetical protein
MLRITDALIGGAGLSGPNGDVYYSGRAPEYGKWASPDDLRGVKGRHPAKRIR